MFIKVHGINFNERIILNVEDIQALQELKDGSKYQIYKDKGAKTVLRLSDGPLPVKESIIMLENVLKKAELIVGGCKDGKQAGT